jgi:hypothetical protein
MLACTGMECTFTNPSTNPEAETLTSVPRLYPVVSDVNVAADFTKGDVFKAQKSGAHGWITQKLVLSLMVLDMSRFIYGVFLK